MVPTDFLTDRSRILTYQQCPRKRWFEYHYNGTGIQRLSKSLPLIFGGAFHSGVEILLKGGTVGAAVLKAQLELSQTFSDRGVDDSDAINAYGMKEQADLAEALIRGWWLARGQQFMDDFEVLEVEQEGRASLGDGITLMFRPDALVRERQTGDLFVISWKTVSRFSKMTLDQMSVDMQSISEVFGIQEQTVQDRANPENDFAPSSELVHIEGVLYLFAQKGQRRDDKYLGHKVQNSPLIYGWRKLGPTPEDTEWSHSWDWIDSDGKNRVLGKGWSKVLVSAEYPGGVANWIEDLHSNFIAPGTVNALEEAFPQSLAISRRADEIESWREQVWSQEQRVLSMLEHLSPSNRSLNLYFPQHTARCFDYSSRCPYYDACFTPAVHADPLGSGLYKIRTANHPEKDDPDEE